MLPITNADQISLILRSGKAAATWETVKGIDLRNRSAHNAVGSTPNEILPVLGNLLPREQLPLAIGL